MTCDSCTIAVVHVHSRANARFRAKYDITPGRPLFLTAIALGLARYWPSESSKVSEKETKNRRLKIERRTRAIARFQPLRPAEIAEIELMHEVKE